MLRFQLQKSRRLAALVRGALTLLLTIIAQTTSLAAQEKPSATYSAIIEGAPEKLVNKLKLISELTKAKRHYPTAAALRRAARRDVEEFNKALRAAGYYAGSADFELSSRGDNDKTQVVFTIAPGEPFQITGYNILYQDNATGRPQTLEDAGVTTNGKADGASLREQQEAFLTYLWNNGYPDAEIITRRVLAEFEKHEAEAVFVFSSGPKARFGKPMIEGDIRTDPSFIARMKTWEEGEEFEHEKMTAYADRIRKTGIFSTVEVTPGKPDENGVAPIIVVLNERKQRTIGAGLSYSTTEGPGGRVFFEHRNMFRHGEQLRFELRGSKIEQSANLAITRPMPRIGGKAFAAADFSNETTDAFDARSVELSGGLTKKWLNDHLETRGAIALETSRIRSNSDEERTYFVSTPLSVIWNNEDDLLDPRNGFRASWIATPYMGTDYFTQSEIAARGRIHFGENDIVTLAARMALGATFGSSFSDLPLNKRFYAGGGGSVRGYGFQEAGPLDADNDPLGGRSKIEGAAEARVEIIRNLQLAAFVDAGSTSTKSLPNFTDEYFIGYGGGLRYLSPIGPIRIDAAFPMEKRTTDSAFQIYIALGQPF